MAALADSSSQSIKNVALIGSSGGGTATLGHTDPSALLRAIHDQLMLVGARLQSACLVAPDHGQGMDGVTNERTTTARLYTIKPKQSTDNTNDGVNCFDCLVSEPNTLHNINQLIQTVDDVAFGREIDNGAIHALICISCHPQLFCRTLTAASKTQIPVTGSGGTSLAQIVAQYNGLTLTGNVGGSVASTTCSRAISYTHALAMYWKRPYTPLSIATSAPNNNDDAKWTSVLNACLPAFWGVCLTKFALQHAHTLLLSLKSSSESWGVDHVAAALAAELKEVLSALENWALPTACAVIMATSTSPSSETASNSAGAGGSTTRQSLSPTSSLIMASILAATACRQSILAGLTAGWLVRIMTPRIMVTSIKCNLPSTMTSLAATGITAFIVTCLLLPIAPLLRQVTALVRFMILSTLVGYSGSFAQCAAAFAWGCLCCYGSKVGWYHAYFLPSILIELELGQSASFLGAVDELCLVLVCAGICAGNLVALQLCTATKLECPIVKTTEASLCRRGLYINLMCGDFVEVCYPYMERHWMINTSGYLASGLSTMVLVSNATEIQHIPKSLAYVPLPISILLAGREWYQMAVACVAAAAIPFVATVVAGMATATKQKQT